MVILGISSLAAQGSSNGQIGPILVVNESSVPMTADTGLTPNVVLVDRSTADASLNSHAGTCLFPYPLNVAG